MQHYGKIETIYQRDIEGTKRLMPGVWRNPTVEFLKDCQWDWTEKIDGSSIAIYWDGHTVEFGGHTSRSNIPAPLVNRLNELFGGEKNAQMFEQMFGDKEVHLYGEGFGNKIQAAGAKYLPNCVDFILFDVMIGENFQPRETVEEIATAFNIQCVPVVGRGTLFQAAEFVKSHPDSVIGNLPMEGVVCRPSVELRDRAGHRLIVKIKYKDFKEEEDE